MKPINIQQKFDLFEKQWTPHVLTFVNDMQLAIAKVSGEFVWHKHDEQDELFLVLKGTLLMCFRDREEEVREGEMILVPKGVEHCPKTRDGEEVHIMLFEPKETQHTGDVKSGKTGEGYQNI